MANGIGNLGLAVPMLIVNQNFPSSDNYWTPAALISIPLIFAKKEESVF